eukprot:59639-Amphidinium_carterae.2
MEGYDEEIPEVEARGACWAQSSARVYNRIGDDQTERALRVTKLKGHDDAVNFKRGFPTFTHRWFERPVFRR